MNQYGVQFCEQELNFKIFHHVTEIFEHSNL